jgi:hypothetical protein
MKKKSHNRTIWERGLEKAFSRKIVPKPVYGRLKLEQFKKNLKNLKYQIESFEMQ